MPGAALLRVLSRNRTGEAVPAYVPPVNPNLLLWSEQFQQAEWVATSLVVTADQTEAPDETTTADLLDPSQVDGEVVQESPSSPVGGEPYTFSLYIKAAPGHLGGGTQISIFDGVDSTVFGATPTASWSRIAVTRTLDAGATTLGVRIIPDLDDAIAIYAWGAKLEEGSVATAYVQREGV